MRPWRKYSRIECIREQKRKLITGRERERDAVSNIWMGGKKKENKKTKQREEEKKKVDLGAERKQKGRGQGSVKKRIVKNGSDGRLSGLRRRKVSEGRGR